MAFIKKEYSDGFFNVGKENGFLPNLSILDLIFCVGPEAIIYLERSVVKV
jgi:hypothetical protein